MLGEEIPLLIPLEHATNLKLFLVLYDSYGKTRREKFLGQVIPEMSACFTAN